MRLPETQAAFIDQIVNEDAELPTVWADNRLEAGIAIYRNGYRSRLLDALAETFPRTKQWVGEENFDQAATHHVIVQPPQHWSLDLAGVGFASTLSGLFRNDPEVSELAALEWDLHIAFVAKDAEALSGSAFSEATEGFSDSDWENLRLTFHPSLTIREVCTNAAMVWRSLTDNSKPPADLLLTEKASLIVWREGMRPAFRMIGADEAAVISGILAGATFDEAFALVTELGEGQANVELAGKILGQWLADQMITDVE